MGIRIFLLLFCLTFSSVAFAQKKEKGEIYRPDIPGNLVFDLGFNFLVDEPTNMDLDFWGSKSVHLYYMYHVQLGKGPISFRPGIGFGLEKYSFDSDVSLYRDPISNEVTIQGIDSLPFFQPRTIDEIRKTKLAANYIDIPIEIGYHFNRADHQRGFKILVGGKVGLLFDSHTKIVYKDLNGRHTFKSKEDFELNTIRYSAYGRIGISGFNLFFEWGFADLFKKRKGPEQTDTSYWKTGLSFNIF